MGQFFDAIPDNILPWLLEQHMFWVASAPLNPAGHVNVSPKGVEGSFHVIDKNTVWYEDLTGSGVETISHLRENGRITIMFHAFEGPPRICRLFGTGTVHEFGTPEYDNLLPPEKRQPGSRSAIVVHVDKVGTSCGYAVPFYEFRCHRNLLLSHFTKKEKVDQDHAKHNGAYGRAKAGLKAYWIENNLQSIDGLPGIDSAPDSAAIPSRGGIEYARDDVSVRKQTQTVTLAKGNGKDSWGTDVGMAGVAIVAFLLGALASMVLLSLFRTSPRFMFAHEIL